MQPAPAAKLPFFLRIMCSLLLLVLTLWTAQYIRCVLADVCYFATDFKVVYRPAIALIAGDLAKVYDTAMIDAWLQSTRDSFFHPTLYPPYSLLLLYPLGWLDPLSAEIIWFVSQFILLVLVLRMQEVRTLWAGVPSRYVYALFLPFIFLAMSVGQLSMLCTALFLLTLNWRRTHPVWAGIAFSILCLKPQMMLALVILLIAEKNRAALLTIVACLTAAIAASLALWGVALWLDYIKITAVSGMIIAMALPVYTMMMSSFFVAVRMLGGSETIAQIAQLILTCTVGFTLWESLTRCKNESDRLLLLAPATLLLTPYAFIYDTMLLAPVCAILAAKLATSRSDAMTRIVIVALAFMPLIATKLQVMHFPYAIIAIALAYIYAWKNVHSITPATQK